MTAGARAELAGAAGEGAQPDYSGSCMIALWPPPVVAEKLAVPGGLPPDEIHLTVAYTGDAADVDPDALAAAARALADRPPVDAVISGHARFTGGDDGDVIVALADSPALDALRRDAETVLEQHGVAIPSEHGFTAHMTICYTDPAAPDPVGRIEPFPVTFGAVSAQHGTQRASYPLCASPGTAGAAPAEAWEALREAAA